MDIHQILSAPMLDIIFEGRNKDYGAYELRSTYNRRLVTALAVTITITALLILIYAAANRFNKPEEIKTISIGTVKLQQVEPPQPPPPPPLPKPQPPAQVATTRNTTIRIMQDDQVNEKDEPPVTSDLAATAIGLVTQDGVAGDDITAPPVNTTGKGIVAPPEQRAADKDETFIKVEIQATFPGGAGAWMRYLDKTFRYPEEARQKEITGTVVVQFIVDKEGNISDVEPLSGPVTGGLREEAVRVIRLSGKWEPAIQNGRKVRSYHKQPITFMLETE